MPWITENLHRQQQEMLRSRFRLHLPQTIWTALTCGGAVDLHMTQGCLQSAAVPAGQVRGELTHRRQGGRANTVAVGGITLTHHRVIAEVPGNASRAF